MERAQTVERALRVLTCFSAAEPELSASEIVRRLDLPRSIVVRLLGTLEASGFLERSKRDSRYRIGLSAFKVGSLYVAANPLFGFITSELARLADETGYTTYFGVMDHAELVIIAHHEGRLPIRFVWTAGDRLPATTTAIGKAMMAHLPKEEIDRLVGHERLAGLTARSISKRSELDDQLAEARHRGWAIARDESSTIGITAIGAAILGGKGQPIGGISLGLLDYPPDPDRLQRACALIRETAFGISERAVAYEEYGHRLSLSGPTKNRPAHIT